MIFKSQLIFSLHLRQYICNQIIHYKSSPRNQADSFDQLKSTKNLQRQFPVVYHPYPYYVIFTICLHPKDCYILIIESNLESIIFLYQLSGFSECQALILVKLTGEGKETKTNRLLLMVTFKQINHHSQSYRFFFLAIPERKKFVFNLIKRDFQQKYCIYIFIQKYYISYP